MKINIKYAVAALALAASFQLYAQDTQPEVTEEDGVVYLAPLFEYPSAPEELTSMDEKCEWLLDNFWTQLDLKSQQPIDQAKLNHAFRVYTVACQYASKEKTDLATDKLLKTLQKNPTLLLQFVKAAEENLYGPRAEVWIDELYVKFLKSAISCKKLSKTRKAKYEAQLKQLEGSMIGESPKEFSFVRANGDEARFFPMSTPTIIFFGEPDCEDCSMSRLKMESNVAFSKAVTDGKINVLFIIPDADEGWQKDVTSFPRTWSVGASDSVSDIYDLRLSPEIYIIGADGKILDKHISAVAAMQRALSLIE